MAFYYNTTTHSIIGTILYSLVFRKDPVDDAILQNLYNQIDTQEPTWEINEKQAAKQETALNRKHQKCQEKESSTQAPLEVRDLVWVYHSQPCCKLDAPWIGLSLVVNAYPAVNSYEVQICPRLSKTHLVNTKNLKLFLPPPEEVYANLESEVGSESMDNSWATLSAFEDLIEN